MILAFDTYYKADTAKTVMVAFRAWRDAALHTILEETQEGIAGYEPGNFYKRELPCILSLLRQWNIENTEAIIIDGFVVLDDHGKFGLGGHLYEALQRKVPVIGVAKSGFHGNVKQVMQLFRGESKKPLYISAMGIDLQTAFEHIQSMHGVFRMPTLLQHLDAKTKGRA